MQYERRAVIGDSLSARPFSERVPHYTLPGMLTSGCDIIEPALESPIKPIITGRLAEEARGGVCDQGNYHENGIILRKC